MKKKILILSAIIILALIGTIFAYWYYWYYRPQRTRVIARETVLNSLEKNFEFCKIVKENIFLKRGEFWLICNERPFYAEYENGNVKYELNGWNFLKKNLDVWFELSNCDFYDSKKVNNNYELTFYCPRNFDSEKIIAKIYRFDIETFKIKKIEEKDFLKIINSNLQVAYPFLSECEIKDFIPLEFGKGPSVLWLIYGCEDGEYGLGLELTISALQPPILLNNLSEKERAKISFEKSFDCKITEIVSRFNLIDVVANCDNGELKVTYYFGETPPSLSYKVKCSEPCLEFLKYFVFEAPKDNVTFIKKDLSPPPKSIYKIDKKMIGIFLENEYKIAFLKLRESLHDY